MQYQQFTTVRRSVGTISIIIGSDSRPFGGSAARSSKGHDNHPPVFGKAEPHGTRQLSALRRHADCAEEVFATIHDAVFNNDARLSNVGDRARRIAVEQRQVSELPWRD
jgi:hypothetical protein